MAMNGEKLGSVVADINVVPLIDVLLVLLIIFLVIAPISPAGLRAEVPMPANSADSLENPIVVQINGDGSLAVNQKILSWDSLGARLSDIYSRRVQKVAFVRGESTTQFSDVARAIGVMRQSGITEIGLLTDVRPGRLPD